MEPDEWTEPVVIFNKQPTMKTQNTQAQGKPKLKPKLTLGITDGDDEELLPNPHSKFPPP